MIAFSRPLLRLIFGLLAIVELCSCSMNSHDPTVAEILQQAPDWLSVSADDARSLQRMTRSLRPALDKAVPEMRAGIQEYLDAFPLGDRLLPESKVFVLNRMYFDVPMDEALSKMRFCGGWNGVPNAGDRVNLMWPVGIDSEGQPQVIGAYAGYRGDVYRALEEFDFFAREYGKR